MRKLIIILSITCTSHGLPIDRVIFACDQNPTYLQFWPLVAKIWHARLGVRPTLALVAKPDVQVDESIGDVIRFEPLDDVPTAQQAQIIRLLLPYYFEDEGCIIADIDMLGLDKSYFVDRLKHYPDDAFIVFRDAAYGPLKKRYPLCYVAAKGRTFKEIFHLHDEQDIARIIRTWYKNGFGWNTDEKCMFLAIKQWRNAQLGNSGRTLPWYLSSCQRLFEGLKDMVAHVTWWLKISVNRESSCNQRLVLLGGRDINRIDRVNWGYDKEKLKKNGYQDVHLLRPYDLHKKEIDTLIAELDL